jgi:hypothetical protein
MVNGDWYTKKRLHDFKLIDSNKCDRCDKIEDREHMLYECPKVAQAWQHLFDYIKTKTKKSYEVTLENILGVGQTSNNIPVLTMIAEIGLKLCSSKRPVLSKAAIDTIVRGLIKYEMAHQTRFKKIQWRNFWTPSPVNVDRSV